MARALCHSSRTAKETRRRLWKQPHSSAVETQLHYSLVPNNFYYCIWAVLPEIKRDDDDDDDDDDNVH